MGGTGLVILTAFDQERVVPVVVEEMTAEAMTESDVDPGHWYSTDGLPYGYEVQAPTLAFDPDHLRVVEEGTRTTFSCEAVLHIFVSNQSGRPALARMAERVARRIEGWVHIEFSDPPSSDLLAYLDRAGRCVRVEDAVYLDAAAMTAWIAHPRFHVLK